MQKLKVLSFLLSFVFVINFTSGCGISSAKSNDKDLTTANCQEGLVIVEQAANSPVQLSINEAKCEDFYTNIKLMLKNVGDKPITGYEISSIQDYGNKKEVKSAQSARGNALTLKVGGDAVILKPNEAIEIVEAGGFTNGTSYGKPVDKLQRVVIRVSFIDFDDGTRWTQENLTR